MKRFKPEIFYGISIALFSRTKKRKECGYHKTKLLDHRQENSVSKSLALS